MNRAVIEWARAQVAPATAKHVLLALATYADAQGLCWPSVATLGSNTGLGERAVQMALRTLEAAGLLAITGNKLGGRGQTPRYRLQVQKGASDAPIDPERTHEKHPKSGLNGASNAPIPAKRVHEAPSKRVHLKTLKGAPDAPELPRTPRREESPFYPPRRQSAPPAEKEPVPDWMPREWGEWETYRLAVSPRTWNAQVRHFSIASLDALRREGHDPAAVIRQAIAGGFTAFRPLPRPAGKSEFNNGFAQMLTGMREARGFTDADEDAEPLPINRFLVGPTRAN